MDPVASHPLLGVAMHAVGATFAATCYTPEKRVKGWSWQTYWLTQASFCWFLLPILGAALTIPQLGHGAARGPARRDAAFVPAGRGLRHRRHGVRDFHPLHRLLADLRHRGRAVQRPGHADPAAGQGHAADHAEQAGGGMDRRRASSPARSASPPPAGPAG